MVTIEFARPPSRSERLASLPIDDTPLLLSMEQKKGKMTKSGMPRAASSIILICNSSFPNMDAELYLSKLGEENAASVGAIDDY